MKMFLFLLTGTLLGVAFLAVPSFIECEDLVLTLWAGEGCEFLYVSMRCNHTITQCYGIVPFDTRINVYKGTCTKDCSVFVSKIHRSGMWLLGWFGAFLLLFAVFKIVSRKKSCAPTPFLVETIPQAPWECPICLGNETHNMVVICGCNCKMASSPMHSPCLKKWCRVSPTCPFCRAPVSNLKVHKNLPCEP